MRPLTVIKRRQQKLQRIDITSPCQSLIAVDHFRLADRIDFANGKSSAHARAP
jgi:hypothetical protein